MFLEKLASPPGPLQQSLCGRLVAAAAWSWREMCCREKGSGAGRERSLSARLLRLLCALRGEPLALVLMLVLAMTLLLLQHWLCGLQVVSSQRPAQSRSAAHCQALLNA